MKFEIDQAAALMVTKAVSAIVLEDPFYGYLLLRQDIVQSPFIPTAGTNGFRIMYNPKFIRKLSSSEIKGLFKHEIMHVAHMHHLRRDKRDPRKWNMACDYAINPILIEAGCSLPPNGMIDPQYKDFGAEHIYNLLPDLPPRGRSKGPGGDGRCRRRGSGTEPGEGDESEPGDGGGDGDGDDEPWNWGGVEDAPNVNQPDQKAQMEADVRQDVLQAINTAKMMGKLPAGLDRLIDTIRESRMPWRQILARLFRSSAKADYSWLRPNRRYLSSGIYLPSLHSDALGPLVIGVDTSGSIAGPELEIFFGCVNGILKQTRPEKIHVVYCDADVGNVQVFLPDEYPIHVSKFKPKGGGGTDFRPVFDYVTTHHLRPCALLYLTDMYGTFPEKPYKYPTIWCATTQMKAPWGKTLEIK